MIVSGGIFNMSSSSEKEITLRKNPVNFFTWSVYFFFAALLLVFSLMSQNFFTFSNIYGTISNGTPLILITCGITFALLTGMIDLSVAGVGFASGTLCGILIKSFDTPIWLAFLAGFFLSLVIGSINSILIVKFKMNVLLTTLGMMLALRGLGKIITKDRIILLGESITVIRQAKINFLGGFPVVLIFVLLIVVISQIVLKYTAFGRHLIAVGNSEKVAKNIGINVQKIKILSLIITSGICGIAGIVWVITLGSVVTRGLGGYEFLAIAAAVLGGTSLFGGRGSFFPGCLLGSFILLFISSGLTIVGASPFIMPFIRGAIIFIAMYADSLRIRFE